MAHKKPSYESMVARIHELENRCSELEKNKDDYELFRQMIENSLDPVFMIDDEDGCRMIYVNDAAQKHYGAPLEEIYTWQIPDWDPNFSHDTLHKHVEEIRNKKHLDIETLHRVNGTEIVPVEVSINIISYKGKQCHYGYIRNISERKKAEQALRDSNEKISLLMNSTAEGIIGIDLDGNCTYANKSGITILGYQSETELLGKNIHNLIHHSYQDKQPMPRTKCRIMAPDDGKGTHVDNEVFWRKDGTCFPVEYYSFPQFLEGNVVGSVVTFNDITERKENEQRIKHYNDDLKELNATKDKLFSIIAHDLKSPFTGILGYLNLLCYNIEQYDNATIKEQLNLVTASAKTVYNLLEAMLMWARSQSGKIKFEPQTLSFKQICQGVTENLRINAENKQISLSYNETNDLKVYADPFMFEMILRNLISNAIKFTPRKGCVDIFAEEIDAFIHIAVIDNGVGIAPENLSKLFDITQKYSSLGTDNERGTGLGLLICKDFVEKHGGKIYVESKLGQGTVFNVQIPVHQGVFAAPIITQNIYPPES